MPRHRGFLMALAEGVRNCVTIQSCTAELPQSGLTASQLPLDKLLRQIESRMKRGAVESFDVMILSNGKAVKILRYKK